MDVDIGKHFACVCQIHEKISRLLVGKMLENMIIKIYKDKM